MRHWNGGDVWLHFLFYIEPIVSRRSWVGLYWLYFPTCWWLFYALCMSIICKLYVGSFHSEWLRYVANLISGIYIEGYNGGMKKLWNQPWGLIKLSSLSVPLLYVYKLLACYAIKVFWVPNPNRPFKDLNGWILFFYYIWTAISLVSLVP